MKVTIELTEDQIKKIKEESQEDTEHTDNWIAPGCLVKANPEFYSDRGLGVVLFVNEDKSRCDILWIRIGKPSGYQKYTGWFLNTNSGKSLIKQEI